jgi:hypothetical protein
MFNAKKYLKLRDLETILYGGPEAIELNYEKDVAYSSGDARNRSRGSNGQKDNLEMQEVAPENFGKEVPTNDWYEYQYDSSNNQVSFNSLSE